MRLRAQDVLATSSRAARLHPAQWPLASSMAGSARYICIEYARRR